MNRGVRRTAALVAAALLAAACSTSDNPTITPPSPSVGASSFPTPAVPKGDALDRFYNQRLHWKDCHGSFQCATLAVPLDYGRPGGSTIGIRVVRLRASGDRIGSLLLNPGGPGASGVDWGLQAKGIIPAEVRSRFDIVGFDPRGVGGSAPVRCATTAQLDEYIAADPTPDSPAARHQLIAINRAFAQRCADQARRLLPHMSTPDAARDMDVLRAALGDRKLSYVGWSYGTYLGAWYAELFPHRVRALILDGAVDPAQSGRDLDRTQAVGFERAFRAFLTWCVAQGCPLGSTYAEAEQGYRDLIAELDRNPVPAPRAPADDGRQVGEAYAVLGTAAALYVRSAWPALRSGLADAKAGDGSQLLFLADQLEERGVDGHYSNAVEANAAVNCVDHPEPRSPARYLADVPRFSRVAPHFGPLTAVGTMTCAFWPEPVTTRQGPLHAAGAAPILVIGTTRDPATPYGWAVALARELDSGVLLTHVGDGHTIYGRGDSCVDDIGDAYLIDRKVPAAHTVC